MAILPGSLDYLYHNGIINHIPYEAYETVPMTASGQAQLSGMGMGHGFTNSPLNYNIGPTSLNGSQYLRQAQGGYLYDTYTSPDVFVSRNNSPIQDREGYSVRKAFNSVMNAPSWLKGLASGGIIIATLMCLLKGKKCPTSQATKPSLFDKLKSLFKK